MIKPSKKKLKFMKAFMLSFFILSTTEIVAAPACHDIRQGGNPIATQRTSSTFTGAFQSSCQSGSPEFYVTDLELFQEIQFSEETDFCPAHSDQNSADEDRVCGPDNLFRFAEHSEKLPLFIEQSKQFLEKIDLPNSFNESALSEEEKLHYQAIIYFCTRSFANPLITKINSSANSVEERLAAFHELKKAGLLHMFSTSAQRLVIDPDLDRGLKKAILYAFLESEPLAPAFVNLKKKAARTIEQIKTRSQGVPLSPRMAQELRRQERIVSSLDSLLNEFVESEHSPEQLPALRLLAGVNIQGADSAALILERKIIEDSRLSQGSSTGRSIASVEDQSSSLRGTLSLGGSGTLHPIPNCNNSNSQTLTNEEYLSIEQLVFAHTDQVSRQDINFASQFLNEFSSQVTWTNLVLTDADKLESFNKFYCHQKAIKDAIANLDQLDQVTADEIFLKISAIPDSISNLSALTSLLPKLSRAKYLAALKVIGTSSNNILLVDEFKATVLFDEFQRVTHNGSDLADTQLTSAIIEALGKNSGFAADAKLSEIFKNTQNEPLRMKIIEAYSNPAFARFGARLNIFHTLFEFPPAARSPYAQALARVVQDNYTDLEATGGANNSSGSMAASEGQINAALAAVMTLNSERTGNLNDGLEDVLTSDGVSRLRSRRIPIAMNNGGVRVNSPDIRDETNDAITAANAAKEAANALQEKESTNPFDAFNQILEDQRINNQPQDDEFIPDAEYLARVTGEREQRDKVSNQDQSETNEVGSGESIEAFNKPVVETAQPVRKTPPSSSFSDPLAQRPLQNEDRLNSNSSTGATSGFKNTRDNQLFDTTANQLQNQIKNLKEEKSQLIANIKRDNHEAGRLSDNSLGARAGAANPTRGSSTGSSSAGRSIASTSAPSSVRAALPPSSTQGPMKTSSTRSAPVRNEEDKSKESPFSKEPLLSPRQQVNTNEIGRVIKIVDEEQKLKFLNYMSVKNEFSCDEINFIESFYKDNINYFFIINNKDVLKSFANVEIDKMTYRFDYPGNAFVEQQKPLACDPNRRVSTTQDENQTERSPSSVTQEEDSRPVRRESIQDMLFNKFKEKFGL